MYVDEPPATSENSALQYKPWFLIHGSSHYGHFQHGADNNEIIKYLPNKTFSTAI